MRITIGRLLAVALLTLCIGLQVLEASGRWDRTFQDAGDEAVVVAVVLCIGAVLLAAGPSRPRLGLSSISSAVGAACPASPSAFVPPPASSAFSASPPLSLRI